MGLDMHLVKCKPTDLTSEDEFGFDLPSQELWEEIQYWRSRPDVHAVMEQIYVGKGGMEDFNWVNLRLRESDISTLETHLDLDDEDVVNFIDTCRVALQEGYALVYQAQY